MGKKQTDSSTTLKERSARKTAIVGLLNELRQKLQSLDFIRPKGATPAELKARIDNIIRSQGGGNEANITSDRAKVELRDLKSQHEDKLQKWVEISNQEKQYKAEMAALEEELRSFEYTASVAEVLDHQVKIAEAAGLIESLKSKVMDQLDIIHANTGTLMDDLYQQRQDLLAESAQGKDVAEKIRDIDDAITSRKENLQEKEKAKGDAENTITGLQRKIAEAEKNLFDLEAENKEFLVHFLVNTIEQAGTQYVELAAKLAASYSNLMGLNEILQGFPSNPIRHFTKGAYSFDIPIFLLKAFQGKESRKDTGKLFYGRWLDVAEAHREAIAKLEDLGITL